MNYHGQKVYKVIRVRCFVVYSLRYNNRANKDVRRETQSQWRAVNATKGEAVGVA